MNRKTKWRMLLLGAASVSALAGTVWLALKVCRAAPAWMPADAVSPPAFRCLIVIAIGVVMLGALAVLVLRTRPRGARGRPGRFHADQGGTAAIEFAFVLPLALMIFLVITQATLLFNANMVVHYAAFAAARVATVVVPLEIGDELRNLVYNPDVPLNPPSEKLEMIRRAAVLALVPISASLESKEAEELVGGASGKVVEDRTRDLFKYFGAKDRAWFRRIRLHYNYANAVTEIELAQPSHWRGEGRDEGCPYRHHRRGDWTQWGWNYASYCPFYDERMDYWYWEDLHVKLTYRYLLEVPYAGRFFGESWLLPDRTGKVYYTEIEVTGTLSNEGGVERRPKDD